MERFYIKIDGQEYTTQEALNEKLRNYTGEINLRNNTISDANAQALARAIPNSAISSLNLSLNNIGKDGAIALAIALSNSNISSIQLEDNIINPDLQNKIQNMVQKTGAERKLAYNALKQDYPDIQQYEDEMYISDLNENHSTMSQEQILSTVDKIIDLAETSGDTAPLIAISDNTELLEKLPKETLKKMLRLIPPEKRVGVVNAIHNKEHAITREDVNKKFDALSEEIMQIKGLLTDPELQHKFNVKMLQWENMIKRIETLEG